MVPLASQSIRRTKETAMGRLYQFAKQSVPNCFNRLEDKIVQEISDDKNRKQRIGLILGTGWSNPDVLKENGFKIEYKMNFSTLGLDAMSGAGHPNVFLFGTWNGHDVVISQGRFHLYQEHAFGKDSLIRRWMSFLIYFMNGSNRLAVTSSVGGLSNRMTEDKLVMPTGIVSAHLPMPYLIGSDGEFVMSEHLIWSTKSIKGDEIDYRKRAFREAAIGADCYSELSGIHYVIPGPGFGGATERKLWADWGMDTVGMSLDPELRLVALENLDNRPKSVKSAYHETDIRVFPTLFVSDAHDLPDNDEIQARAKAMAPKFGKFLSGVVKAEW